MKYYGLWTTYKKINLGKFEIFKKKVKKLSLPHTGMGEKKVCLSLCLILDHALASNTREVIFGMYSHMNHESKIGYMILTSEGICGHQR